LSIQRTLSTVLLFISLSVFQGQEIFESNDWHHQIVVLLMVTLVCDYEIGSLLHLDESEKGFSEEQRCEMERVGI